MDETLRAGDEQFVSDLLAEHLVDVSEAVDVDEDRRNMCVTADRCAQRACEMIDDGRPVREVGQRVEGRSVGQFVQLGLRVGDVVEEECDLAGPGRRVDRRRRPQDELASGQRPVIDPSVPRDVSAAEHVGGQLIEKRAQHAGCSTARGDVGERRDAEQVEHWSVQVTDRPVEAQQRECDAIVVERTVDESVVVMRP